MDTDEFVINTPTIRATKFWPGVLGVGATHAVVFARLIIGQKDFGVQPFMVQIRCLQTHKALSGIEVGDVGTKLGYNAADNGFCSFNQVRIPRTHLLSRFVEVSKDGKFTLKGDKRMTYQTMSATRLMIILGASLMTIQSARTVVRYSVCRRQFKTIDGKSEERKLLDYQTHMAVIGPHLATAFAIHFAGLVIAELNAKITSNFEENVGMLDLVHHLMSGVKAYAGEFEYTALDEMRQCCGGAGFLKSSGIA